VQQHLHHKGASKCIQREEQAQPRDDELGLGAPQPKAHAWPEQLGALGAGPCRVTVDRLRRAAGLSCIHAAVLLLLQLLLRR
jgi:hypothetical protein